MSAEGPSGMRKTIDRLARKNSVLEAQNERLVKMILLERLKDGNIDFSEGLDLLDHFRPPFDGVDGYDLRFSAEAVASWLSARKVSA